MVNALNPAVIVRILTLLVLALAMIALTFAGSAGAVAGLVQSASVIVLIVNLVVFLLTLPPVFRWMHRLTRADHWWFPLLDGDWDGEVDSNWPRVHTMLRAARREIDRFDPFVDDLPADAPPRITRVTASFKSGLFGIELVLRMPGTQRSSRSLFVRPVWCKPNPPTIQYVYRQRDDAIPAITDERTHLGAALLELRENGELRGDYWTQRQRDRGLNTAGTLTLRRITAASVQMAPRE